MVVQLKHASPPLPLGLIAAHFWFTVTDRRIDRCERWEVWQTPNAGGVSFGHLHCNLQSPDGGVGGSASVVTAEWRQDEARRLVEVLIRAKGEYPYRHHYRAWPGPNSNTFVAWVLRRAKVAFPLPWKAHGKNYPGAMGWRSSSQP